jgi:hypothetical protein
VPEPPVDKTNRVLANDQSGFVALINRLYLKAIALQIDAFEMQALERTPVEDAITRGSVMDGDAQEQPGDDVTDTTDDASR